MSDARNARATPAQRPRNEVAQLSPYTPRVLRTPLEGCATLTPIISAPSAPARERGTDPVPPSAGRSRGRCMTVPMPGLPLAEWTGALVFDFRSEPEGTR